MNAIHTHSVLLRAVSAVLAFCLCASACLFAVFADTTDSGYTYIADSAKKTAQITGYTGSSHILKIPSSIDGYKVTSIKSEAFKGKSTLLSVEIPDTVTNIGSEAFADCTLMGTVSLGTGVSTIGAKAFQNCAVLTTITIPAATSSIGAGAFSGCKMLNNYTVDTGNLVYKSADDALYNKLGSTLIRYPAAHTRKSYTLPSGVLTIESGAFEDAKHLTEVDTGNSVTTVKESAFKNCTALEKITLSTKVTKLEDELFSGCKKLSSVGIPTTITAIGASAFKDCVAIPSLRIPDTVTTIGTDAFSGCTGMASVTIGKGLTTISGAAFKGCSGLKEFKLSDGAAYTVAGGVLFNKDGTRLIAYPAGKADKAYTVGDKVTAIGVYAFDSCKNLESLTVPATVKTLAKPVIHNCGNTVVHVEPGSPAETYFKAETSGYASLKIGNDKPGDVNLDGQIDNADVILVRRYVAKWSSVTIDKTAADVNKDGNIDNADAILLRRYVAKWPNVTLK